MSGASAARLRHQFVLDAEIVERLEALTAKPGVSKSSIVREALKEWMNREAVPVLDSRFAPRLNQISRQLERIERNGKIALEVQALFVRYMLASIPPVPENDAVARAQGRERFEAFTLKVAEAFSRGGGSFDSDTGL
ncbi:ribbon-helix-helix protein, CopG family [Sphingopyxis indica]|uniref:ribbon-helix-helix protein, CopG family n=1 Tax=Sphingopyxis indica TaxID=436663 RepID=UPI002938D5A9|nr:ribbon-helix-helix protein, CopG family [Sphingopyxis indica]WOF44555.1 ribbon-helix-helix protein, CopG family [Sphingopyxis indica]